MAMLLSEHGYVLEPFQKPRAQAYAEALDRDDASGLICPRGLEQEPCTPLGLIDPDFQQARGSNIVVLVAQAMRLAQACRQLLIVIAQFGEHVHRRDKIRIVVQDALQAADVADRMQGRAADLANTFGDRVRSGEDLVSLLIEQKVIFAKMRTRHVPMKVLGFQIQSEHVGEQDIQRARKIPHGIRLQVAWRVERSGPCFGISNSNLHFLSPFVSLNARSDECTYAHPSSTSSILIGSLRTRMPVA